jgi:hypothetical protein
MPGNGPRTENTNPWRNRQGGFRAGNWQASISDPGVRLGLRRGFCGSGSGWRHQFWATGLIGWRRGFYTRSDPKQELAELKIEADWLKERLDELNRLISELESGQE